MSVNDLNILIEKILTPCELQCSQVKPEKESAEYDATGFKLNELAVQYRRAKITPTKVGQFVTLWKRDAHKQPIRPYQDKDSIDLAIIAARKDGQLGYFIFPLSVLCKQGIVTHDNKPGKRGFRVYPIWDKPLSKQAKKTQEWQLRHFLDLSQMHGLEVDNLQGYFNLDSLVTL
ncbi:MAG: MepB family protein [Bermanella sp.]